MHLLFKTKMALSLAALSMTASTFLIAQSSVTDCASITDSDERLACYDRAAENARNLPVVRIPRGTRSAPQTDMSPDNKEDTAFTARQEEFGFSRTQYRERTFTVVSATHNDFTGWTIEFEGGGTWKQVGTDDYPIREGERYTIRRNSFNSYMLSNSRNNKKIRISRVE